MKKVNYNQVAIACLLSFTMLTTSGCMVEKKSKIASKSFMSSQTIESVEEPIEKIDVNSSIEFEEIKASDDNLLVDNSNNSETTEEIISSSITEQLIIDNNEQIEIVNPIEQLLNQLINADYGYTSNMQEFYNEHCDLIENITMEDNMNIKLHYCKLAYQKLLNAEIPYEIMISELNTLMIEQQLPRCMSEEDWQFNFGNLISTLSEEESLVPTYFPLAYLIHQSTCTEEHEIDFCVTCKTLKKEFENKYQQKVIH